MLDIIIGISVYRYRYGTGMVQVPEAKHAPPALRLMNERKAAFVRASSAKDTEGAAGAGVLLVAAAPFGPFPFWFPSFPAGPPLSPRLDRINSGIVFLSTDLNQQSL